MNTATGIVLFAHGSRDPGWRAPIEAVRSHIEQLHPNVRVRCAYLEMCGPELTEAVQSLADEGARHVKIVPMFLGTGRHVRENLPVKVAAIQALHPGLSFRLEPSIGEDPRLIVLMAQITSEAWSMATDVGTGGATEEEALTHNDQLL